MRSSFSRLLVVGLVGANLVGCGGGASSPQGAFNNLKAASEKKDVKAVMDCMSEDTVNSMAGAMAMSGVMMKGMAGLGGANMPAEVKDSLQKMDAVLTKHGLTDEYLKKQESKTKAGPGDFDTKNKEFLSVVKDKPAFIADMLNAMPKKDGKTAGEEMFSRKWKSLKDVKINGDTATGTAVLSEDGKDTEEPMAFKKEKDGWKIAVIESRKETFKPAK